jgi:hypothetical protein
MVHQNLQVARARSRSSHILGHVFASPEPLTTKFPHLRLARGYLALGPPNLSRPSPSQAIRTKRARRPTRDTRIQCTYLPCTTLQVYNGNKTAVLSKPNIMIMHAPLCVHVVCHPLTEHLTRQKGRAALGHKTPPRSTLSLTSGTVSVSLEFGLGYLLHRESRGRPLHRLWRTSGRVQPSPREDFRLARARLRPRHLQQRTFQRHPT